MKGVKIKMKKLALQVSPMGEITELDISQDSLKTLQTAVDGLIQPIDYAGFTVWVNEEGLLRNDLEQNLPMMSIYRTPIMGNAVFTGGVDSEGETLGLPEQYETLVRDICQSLRSLIS